MSTIFDGNEPISITYLAQKTPLSHQLSRSRSTQQVSAFTNTTRGFASDGIGISVLAGQAVGVYRNLMHSRVFGLLGLVLSLCATTAFGTDEPKDSSRGKPPVFDIVLPVYPFEALLHNRKGKVELECLFTRQGQLVSAKVTNKTDADFAGAALAYADAFIPAMLLWAAKPGEGLLQFNQTIEFSEEEEHTAFRPLAAPSKAALIIIGELQRNPAWKGYSTGKMLDRPLEVVSQVAPVFPLQLVNQVESGTAMIEFFVDEKGFAEVPRVVSASDPAFGYAACQCISVWKFKPPLKGGKPTVVKVRVPVMFSLAGKPK